MSETLATLKSISTTVVNVQFHANVKGVTPGQSAVFYEGNDVVGGALFSGVFWGSTL